MTVAELIAILEELLMDSKVVVKGGCLCNDLKVTGAYQYDDGTGTVCIDHADC